MIDFLCHGTKFIMDGHAFAKFSSGIIKQPLRVQERPGASMVAEEKYPDTQTFSETDETSKDPLYVHQPEPPNFQRLSESDKIQLQSFTVDRATLTADFYQKLQELQKEHQKTLKLVSQLQLDESARRQCHDRLSRGENGEEQFSDPARSTDYHYVESSDDDAEPIPSFRRKKVDFEHRFSRSGEDAMVEYDDDDAKDSDADDSYIDSSCDVIERMWDDFSVDDYVSNTRMTHIRRKANLRPKSAPLQKKEWSPVITIPKPFKMTLREERKKEKSHSGSSHEIMCRQKQKEEEEEAELKKRVRAREPPAHVYLPLYEEMKERREQRSRFNRENAIATLVATQKPFSFDERDERKRILKEIKKEKEDARELRRIKRMTQFEANPVPYSVHDPSVSDRLIEEQLYRKIKNKMRSEDLMRSSALPPRLHAHELMAQHKRKAWLKEVEKVSAFPFQPKTSEVPDFDALHKHEQLETLKHRNDLATTVVEPFHFRTSKRLQKRQEMRESMEEAEQSFEKESKIRPDSGRKSTLSDTIPTRMTDSARLRIDNMRRSLQEAERIIKQAKEDEFERRERRKRLAQQVAQKAADYEVAASTQKQSSQEEKLRQYKKQMRNRELEYKKFLDEVKGRVDERPLLFEQHAEKVAKAQAEKRYREILETSGLSDDFVDRKARLSFDSDHSVVLSPRAGAGTDCSYDSESELKPSAFHSSTKRSTVLSSTTNDVGRDDVNRGSGELESLSDEEIIEEKKVLEAALG